MSSALAIGAVTAVMRDLLNNGLIDQEVSSSLGSDFTVTVLPPDVKPTTNADTQDQDRLNLFLYQVTPNQGWRNVGLPSRDANGDRLTNPPLALDLHYLLTAYSQEPFHAEILLGYAMQLLHETPILTRSAIRTALGPPSPPLNGSILPPAFQALAAADLADQVEQIKVTPEVMSSEEISKLWSAFQTNYRPTAAYQASVVLIESRRPTRTTLPVLQSRLHVLPFQPPAIATVLPQMVIAGSQLTLQGQNLKANTVSVQLGGITVVPDTLTDTQIQVTVPTGLLAGISTVQVIHSLDFGAPSGIHRGFESNVMPFVLRPRVTSVTAAPGSTSGITNIMLQVEPVIGKTQRVRLRLSERTSGMTATYTASSDQRAADTGSITIPLTEVKAANYAVWIQVDGAESLPDFDRDPQSPTYNQYLGTPNVTITCSSNCLRSTAISLSSALNASVLTVTGGVTVQDEASAGVRDVAVAIVWTLPDGTTRNDASITNASGVVSFNIAGEPGTYTLTVTSLSKPNYCFDPPNSPALTDSITG